jgi:hypothetical protein
LGGEDEKALSLAELGGYVRTFLDEGDPMGDLLERAVLEGVSVDYARSLLGAFESPAPIVTVSSIPGGPAPAVEEVAGWVEPLSRRELDVLKYLATELTGPEIARELMEHHAYPHQEHIRQACGQQPQVSGAESQRTQPGLISRYTLNIYRGISAPAYCVIQNDD